MSLSDIPHHPVPETDCYFDALGLSEPILACINQVGFTHPTPIQQAVIPIALTGQDVIGLAQTGSGKTAAFVLPLAERLTHGSGVRGLILSPTREIALQTQAFIDLFGKDHHLQAVCLIGGVKIGPQLRDLKHNPDILVATPGRLVDHLERGTVRLDGIEELVLDEADHMLDLGFLPQIENILRRLPRKRHTMMFSATMPAPIERLAQQFLNKPVRIDILPEGKAAEGITHKLYLVDKDAKGNALIALLKQEPGKTLIFVREKVDAEWLSRELTRDNLPVARIHSNRSQSERVDALESFRDNTHRILIATDIASRGIDVRGIEHVINFDMPETVEDYIHRAGRTARAHTVGCVSTIATWRDKTVIVAVERELGQQLPRNTLPGVKPYVEFKKP